MTSSFKERLVAPAGWWVAGLVVAGFVAATVHSGASGWRAVTPYVLAPAVVLAALAAVSRHRVVVADGVLHVPGARAPLTAFGPAEVLDADGLRLWRGQRAHPWGFAAVQPWSRSGVLLPVVDPDDDTPYWLVATRRPVDLVVALEGQSFSGS